VAKIRLHDWYPQLRVAGQAVRPASDRALGVRRRAAARQRHAPVRRSAALHDALGGDHCCRSV